ncbi:MAG: hypothetical protein AB1578_20040 [Thermodesulfobacteriota bacterium]
MRELLREMGIATWRDAAELAGTILALLVILVGTALGMVLALVLAGVPLR